MTTLPLSVILPVYRQADHIGEVVAAYCQALAALPGAFELILVVNGPLADGSLDVCKRLAETHASVRVVHSEPAGWGRAVKAGIRASRGDWICYTNSARTLPEELFAAVSRALAAPQADAVYKARRKVRDGFRRWAGSFLYNLECRLLFNLQYRDINGTPKVFPRRFEKLLHLTRDDDLIDLEFCIHCRREGYPVHDVLSVMSRRHGGTSTTTLRSAFRLYAEALRLRFPQRRPGP